MRKKFLFSTGILILFLVLFTSEKILFSQDKINRNSPEHSWQWQILVIPPKSGWDNEPGRSISNALAWCEKEISASGSGVGGHDINFIRFAIPEGANIKNLSFNLNSASIAVMSFADYETDKILVERLSGNQIPLILSGGEDILLDENGPPIKNIFALDLYRDYRCSTFAKYAKKIFKPDARVALAAGRFTLNQEREAKICYDFLDRAGFMPMPFWADASVRDTFNMMSEEIESQENNPGVMITFLGSMGSREIWRNFMRIRTAWRLWNCTAPAESFLSCRGMVFADQNIKLPESGGFTDLKRHIWMTRALHITDTVAAGRAIALSEWIKMAVNSLPQPVNEISRPALLKALENVKNIPFGNQKLNINPNLHRPYSRNIYIVEVRDHNYKLLDTISTEGMKYTRQY